MMRFVVYKLVHYVRHEKEVEAPTFAPCAFVYSLMVSAADRQLCQLWGCI